MRSIIFFFFLNKTGEFTACLCVCGNDLCEGQSAHVRARRDELDQCS